MKRSPALTALSHDHHHALDAALRLTRRRRCARRRRGRDHVRFEERELFGLLEERLPEGDLARLGEAIEHAEASEL